MVHAKKKLSELDLQAEKIAVKSAQIPTIDKLQSFDPAVVRKLIKRIRVFSNGALEFDLAIDGAFVDRVHAEMIK